MLGLLEKRGSSSQEQQAAWGLGGWTACTSGQAGRQASAVTQPRHLLRSSLPLLKPPQAAGACSIDTELLRGGLREGQLVEVFGESGGWGAAAPRQRQHYTDITVSVGESGPWWEAQMSRVLMSRAALLLACS